MENRKTIMLDGDLSIRNAAKIQERLLQVLTQDPYMHLKVSNPTDIDLTFIQLLQAVQRQAPEVKVSFQLSEELTELLERAGFTFYNSNF